MKFLFALSIVLILSVSPSAAHDTLETELHLFSYQPFPSFPPTDNLTIEGEKHFKNIKQLSFGGENAEAYFSSDGKQLIFQSKRDGRGCDQIYTMNADGSNARMISNSEGRTTC